MIFIDLYNVVGFIVATVAFITLRPRDGFFVLFVLFFLAMFFWPVTAGLIILNELEKKS